ncbi:MAG: APC family permease [Ilumatobacteraceae bacterium]
MATKQDVLKQGVIGFPTALATAVGLIIASSVLLTATQGFGAGGGVFAWAILIAFVLMLFQVMVFSEAGTTLPLAGSVYDYINAGLGRWLAVTGTIMAYLVVHLFAGTAETAAIGLFANVNFGFMEGMAVEDTWVVGVGLVVLFGVVNVLGVELYGAFEVVLTAVMWATLVLFGLIGLFKASDVELSGWFGQSFVGTDLEAVLTLTGLAMFLFVGVEYVTPLATELRDASRNIPRAMFIGLIAVALAIFVYGGGITRQVSNDVLDPATGLTKFDTPLPIPEFGDAIMGTFGRYWLAIAVLFAGAATVSTLIAGIPRILYGMAKDGVIPKAFAYLHPRFKTPVVGILVAVLIPSIYAVIIKGDIDSILVLILAGVCAWLFGYILVNVSMTILRMTQPDLRRPYRMPLFPLPAVIASAGMLVTIWYIAPPGITRGEVYVRFFVILAIVAALAALQLVFVAKKPLFARPTPDELAREESS